MENLQIYMNEINKIFSCLNTLENSVSTQDDINFISNLKEYKEEMINYKNIIEQIENENTSLERQV